MRFTLLSFLGLSSLLLSWAASFSCHSWSQHFFPALFPSFCRDPLWGCGSALGNYSHVSFMSVSEKSSGFPGWHTHSWHTEELSKPSGGRTHRYKARLLTLPPCFDLHIREIRTCASDKVIQVKEWKGQNSTCPLLKQLWRVNKKAFFHLHFSMLAYLHL